MEGTRLTFFLIGLNVLMFLLIFSMPQELMEKTFSSLSFSGETALQAWRWLTSLFLHVSASHLFFNMLGLYFFGRTLEHQIHKQWYLAIYFISGLLGNFVFMLSSGAQVAGASGAVFGVMGATMFLDPLKKIRLYIIPLPLAFIAVPFVILETFIVAFQPAFADKTVANVSHVAGILAGTCFAFFYSPKKSMKGLAILLITLVFLIFLGPVFSIITGVGGILLQGVDYAIGLVLYSLAKLLGFLWI